MTPQTFLQQYRDCFGPAELPLAVAYTDDVSALSEPARGCFIKALKAARNGETMTLTAETIKCGGGRVYTGFSDLAPQVCDFVSLKEKYLRTPDMLRKAVDAIGLPKAEKPGIRFTRLDRLDSFDDVEGLIFFATPDVLSGLAGWAFYDVDAQDAVCTPFGSGCAVIIANMVAENRRKGNRCFLGLFDPSVRPAVEANTLGFSIPMSRLIGMAETMDQCFLKDSHAWAAVRKRIDETPAS